MNSLSYSASAHDQEISAETFAACVEQAEICCEQARVAARQRRYKAAHGLFSTALALYGRATTQEGISYQAVEARLREVENEMAAYSELAKSMARPMNAASPAASPAVVTRYAARNNLWLEK